MNSLTTLLNQLLRKVDIEVCRSSPLLKREARLLAESRQARHDLEILRQLPADQLPELIQHLSYSRAQKRQDLFVLAELHCKRGGYFVEIGAADGMLHSNTYLLEQRLGWTGILAEPARCWIDALKKNRTAHIDTRCVWKTSDETVQFKEVDNPVLSTVAEYGDHDGHATQRGRGTSYPVRTISLDGLLDSFSAPAEIDYLSIDTEGSEFDILKAFDFSKRRIRTITVEHNHTPARDAIHELLCRNRFVRKMESISAFDDWYVEAR